MPRLPTPAITWRFRNNESMTAPDALLHRARMMLEIKESMIVNNTGWTDGDGAAVSPSSAWTVRASSDSITADGTDRWSAQSDIVWDTSGSAHSWIVLNHPNFFAAGVALEVLFDCSQFSAAENNAVIGVFFSMAGFDLGAPTVTNRPTALDEREVLPQDGTLATAPWQGPATVDAAHRAGRLNVHMSDDARYVRWYIYRGGNCVGRGDLFPVDDYDRATEWSCPALMQVYGRNGDVEINLWSLYRTGDGSVYQGTDTLVGDFEAMASSPQSTVSDTSVVDEAAISFNGAWGLGAIGLVGVAPLSGAFAGVPDQWWGNVAVRGQGFPGDASNQFVQIGDMITAWNRSTLLTS